MLLVSCFTDCSVLPYGHLIVLRESNNRMQDCGLSLPVHTLYLTPFSLCIQYLFVKAIEHTYSLLYN